MTGLHRFLDAQDPVFATARAELAAGRKRTHWMWFVFPQLRGLGHSDTARFYGLDGLEEARAYLGHAVLGPRLLDCTALMLAIPGRSTLEILGSPDDMKFRSCMTLFAALQDQPFAAALARFCAGAPDPTTLEMLRAA